MSDIAFERLHRLVRKGYVPELAEHDGCDDLIFLHHLGSGPRLMLYPDGMLVQNEYPHRALKTALGEDDSEDRLMPDEKHEFSAFMQTFKAPTWRERSAPAREKYLYTPGCLIAFFAASLVFGKAISYLWERMIS